MIFLDRTGGTSGLSLILRNTRYMERNKRFLLATVRFLV